MRLFRFECKKILTSKVNMAILLAFVVISIFFFRGIAPSSTTSYFHADGSIMSTEEVLKEEDKEKQKWTGEMNEEWWTRLQEEASKATRRYDEHIYDFKKMEATYGSGWYEDYLAHPNSYANEDADDSYKEGKRILISNRNSIRTKEDISDLVVMEFYMNYGKTMMEKKSWNFDKGIDGVEYSVYDNSSADNFVYPRSGISEVELDFMKDRMNEKTFHYGNSKRWKEIIEVFEIVGPLLMIWMILTSSDMINKERKKNMMELLGSSTCRKKDLFIAKIAALITCGLFAILVFVGGLMLYAGLNGDIGDAMVNMTEQKYSICIFTYGEAFLLSILSFVMGVIIFSILGVLTSTYLKSSYKSLGLLLAVSFVPMFLNQPFGNINVFLPNNIINGGYMVVYYPTAVIFQKAFYSWIAITIVYLPLIIILIYIAWRKYNDRKYPWVA